MSAMSCVSAQSASSCGSRETLAVGAGEVRRRLEHATQAPPPNAFKHDPHDPSATALKVNRSLLVNITFITIYLVLFI